VRSLASRWSRFSRRATRAWPGIAST
jgi:hypothetical protein